MITENIYETRKIRTFTGKYIDVFDPDPDSICIEDIAHSLSQMPRFGGHLPEFYSVAMHCIEGLTFLQFDSMESAVDLQLQWLMHDSTEAYLMDMPKPIKNNLPEYKAIEENLMSVIAKKFGFQFPFHPEIKLNDNRMLQYEWNEKMIKNTLDRSYYMGLPMKDIEIIFLSFFRQFT